MAKRDKLKAKLFAIGQEKSFRFDDLCMLLQHLGFTERSGKGSHRIFYREGIEEIIDLQHTRDGKAKPYQVRQEGYQHVSSGPVSPTEPSIHYHSSRQARRRASVRASLL